MKLGDFRSLLSNFKKVLEAHPENCESLKVCVHGIGKGIQRNDLLKSAYIYLSFYPILSVEEMFKYCLDDDR